MMQQMGKILILVGGLLLIVGLIAWLAGNKLSWFGNLPGDIYIKRDDFQVYIPLASMLLLSIVLSALMWLYHKFFS